MKGGKPTYEELKRRLAALGAELSSVKAQLLESESGLAIAQDVADAGTWRTKENPRRGGWRGCI